MKILCINGKPMFEKVDAPDNYSLTIGKWYDVIKDVETHYYLVNDRGLVNLYPKKWFKIQQEVREEKLKEIGL